jgi:hypothetical protein
MNPKIKQLRRLAYEESLALREWGKAGRRVPKVAPLAKPWHPHFVDTSWRLDREEVLPEADERPWATKEKQ